MYWKLCVHCFIGELISVLISLTENRTKGCFFKSCEDSFCFLIQNFQSSVFDFVDSLKLLDDEFAIHHEVDFGASEFFYGCETENSPHIFCLIVGCRSEEKFASFYDLVPLAHDKSAPAWAGVSS